VRERLRRAVSHRASIAVSSVVLYELWCGGERSRRRRENAERLRVFLSGNIDVVPFSEEDAVAAGELRAALERGDIGYGERLGIRARARPRLARLDGRGARPNEVSRRCLTSVLVLRAGL
jgi:predicted nucleic acid-binding protein